MDEDERQKAATINQTSSNSPPTRKKRGLDTDKADKFDAYGERLLTPDDIAILITTLRKAFQPGEESSTQELQIRGSAHDVETRRSTIHQQRAQLEQYQQRVDQFWTLIGKPVTDVLSLITNDSHQDWRSAITSPSSLIARSIYQVLKRFDDDHQRSIESQITSIRRQHGDTLTAIDQIRALGRDKS